MSLDGNTTAAIIFTSMIFSPVMIVSRVLRHREKMAALRNRQETSPQLNLEIAALRQEVAALRDTTTRFDMSFDAALHRAEQRLDALEQPAQSAYSYAAARSDTVVNEEQTVRMRGGT